MISIFLGMTIANLLMLSGVLAVGWIGSHGSETMARFHVALGITATLLCCLAHLTVYTYFMATSRWLRAATDKAALPVSQYVVPSNTRKRQAMMWAMGAITTVMLAAFAGAGADSAIPIWPLWVHTATAFTALGANAVAAGAEYRLIRIQGRLMDDALAQVNHLVDVQSAASPGAGLRAGAGAGAAG